MGRPWGPPTRLCTPAPQLPQRASRTRPHLGLLFRSPPGEESGAAARGSHHAASDPGRRPGAEPWSQPPKALAQPSKGPACAPAPPRVSGLLASVGVDRGPGLAADSRRRGPVVAVRSGRRFPGQATSCSGRQPVRRPRWRSCRDLRLGGGCRSWAGRRSHTRLARADPCWRTGANAGTMKRCLLPRGPRRPLPRSSRDSKTSAGGRRNSTVTCTLTLSCLTKNTALPPRSPSGWPRQESRSTPPSA